MHELAIAQDIVKQAVEEAQRRDLGQIKALHVRLGPAGFATKEALTFCLQASCDGTIADKAQVHVREVDSGGIVLEGFDVNEPECA